MKDAKALEMLSSNLAMSSRVNCDDGKLVKLSVGCWIGGLIAGVWRRCGGPSTELAACLGKPEPPCAALALPRGGCFTCARPTRFKEACRMHLSIFELYASIRWFIIIF